MKVPVLFATCLAAFLAACGNSGVLNGTWSEPEEHLTIDFNPDGTFVQTNSHGPLHLSYDGHYTFSRNHLSMKFEKVTYQGVPEAEKAKLAQAANYVLGTHEDADIEFLTPDRINVVNGMKTETMDRSKGR
jgi:major membrane immunogen (membrane-anchored lipoprotein)